MAEDMRQIDDHSVDVVVATYLLCSVKDRYKTLKEITRVLKKVFKDINDFHLLSNNKSQLRSIFLIFEAIKVIIHFSNVYNPS